MENTDPWVPLLRNLKLNRTEKAIVSRYEKAPKGRAFLPVSDILKNHNLNDESLEMLMKGVQEHPRYTAARIILTTELFDRGMAKQAWTILEATVDSIKENVLAQRTRFKLSIFLGKEYEARETYAHLSRRGMADDETGHWGDALRVKAFSKIAEDFRHDMKNKGIPLTDIDEFIETDTVQNFTDEKTHRGSIKENPSYHYDQEFLEGLKGYHQLPIEELRSMFESKLKENEAAKPEPDSLTLAEIYESRGYKKKALKIYTSLLNKNPKSELYNRKVLELSEIRTAENLDYASEDKKAIDHLVQDQSINRKVAILNNLLKVLE